MNRITATNVVSRDIAPELTDVSLQYMKNGDIQGMNNSEGNYYVQNVLGNISCLDIVPLGVIRLDKEQYILFHDNTITLFDAENCVSKEVAKGDCLNFTNPINGVYKYYQGHRYIYWVEKGNPWRYLNIDECEPKVKTSNCEDCLEVFGTDLDCDFMLFNKKFNIPCIELEELKGNIPNGVYQVALAYSIDGSRVTDYYTFPNVIKLFSHDFTHGINVKLGDCVNSILDEYELVLITQRADRSVSAQRIGFFNTSQRSVFIDSLDESFYTPIDIEVLLSSKVYYEEGADMAVNGESLVVSGIKVKEDFDYRLSAQNITGEWVSIATNKEEAHKYHSLMRDEVYAFDIAFVYADGQISHKTHIPNLNPGLTYQGLNATDTAPTNNDYFENNPGACYEDVRRVFEVYNTATVTTANVVDCTTCGPTEQASGQFAYWESNLKYPNDYPGLGCTPIKYHKMPSHDITHIHDGDCINILTARFSNIAIPQDCDGNNLPITGYIIYVSDRDNHKSVLHKGLVYNTRNYTESCETIEFPNYPFNDLNSDVFLLDEKRSQSSGVGNQLNDFNYDRYTYHSPDIHFIKGSRGSELKVYTEEIGRVRGEYHYTENYPRYQQLSQLGNIIVQSVGVLETFKSLYGDKEQETVVEKTLTRLKERVTDITDFPIAEYDQNSIGGGGGNFTLAFAPPGGTLIGNFNPNSGGSGNTTVSTHSYKSTREGDPDCNLANSYITQTATLEDFGVVNALIPTLDNRCRLRLKTTAPEGVGVRFIFNGRTYTGVTDENGNVTFFITNDCADLADLAVPVLGTIIPAVLDISFTPECDCDCDEETKVTTKTKVKENRVDLLDNMGFFERVPVLMFYYSEGILAARRLLQSVIKPKQYAIEYSTVADYNDYIAVTNLGDQRRRIELQRYIEPIKQLIDGNRFQAWNNSEYIRLNNTLPAPTTEDFTRVLHGEAACDTTDCPDISSFAFDTDVNGKRIQASSYYVGFKRYNPNQYGRLDDYVSRQASCIQTNFNQSDVIYAGDIHISKFQVQRKMEFFDKLPTGLNDNTDFDLSDYFSLAYPRFWMDVTQDSVVEEAIETLIPGGNRLIEYNLEAIKDLGDCMSALEQSLHNIGPNLGILGIITEITAFITDIVNGGTLTNPFKLDGLFYTHVTGVADFWVESEFIGDYRLEKKHYPFVEINDLSKGNELFEYNLQYLWDGISKNPNTLDPNCCRNQYENTIVYSVRNDQDSSMDNWLKFLPNNFQRLPNNTGTFTGMVEIDDYNLFLAFEDGVYVTQQDEGLITDSGNRVFLGTSNGFQRRLKRLSTDSTGYTGCIDKESIVSTRYGVYWFDRKRKKFFRYGNQVEDVTGEWQSFFNANLDRPIQGIYDNYSDRLYYSTDKWTVSFAPKLNKFVGFHSFIPDSYIQMTNNYLTIKNGIWKHNSGKYQTYYNTFYPFEVSIQTNEKFNVNILQSLKFYSEYYRSVDYDTKVWLNKFFDKIMIHNNQGSTGIVDLYLADPNKPSLSGTPVSKLNGWKYQINKFKDANLTQPYIRWDGMNYTVPQIINPNQEFGTMQGNYYNIHLIADSPLYDDAKIKLKLLIEQNDGIIQ